MCAGAHFFCGAQRNDVAFVDENHAVGDEESAGELVRHDDDRHVKRLLEFENELIDSSGDDGIEAGRRFVEKKNFRIHGEGAGDGCALFHSAAQLRRNVILVAGKTDLIEFEAKHDVDRGIFEFGVFAQRKRDVFANGHGPEQCSALKRHAHVAANVVKFVGRNRGKVFAFDPDLAGGRTLESDESAEQCAFARAGTAKNDQRFSLLHIKTYAVKNFAIPVADAEVAQRDRWRHLFV